MLGGAVFLLSHCPLARAETPDLPAQALVLMEASTGQVLYEKSAHVQQPCASITKVMTALVCLRNVDDLQQEFTVTQNSKISVSGSSMAYIHPGETLTIEELLYGMLLPSGNDAAVAVAEATAGSVDAFVQMMNETAMEIGATGCHFVNVNGLPDENHYTSVYDLYLIFQNAVQNQTFLDIISTMSYDVVYTDVNGAGVEKTWENTNQYLTGKEKAPEGITVVGGKTGTTGAAGYCLVLYSYNASGQPIVSIVLKADGKSNLYLLMNEMLSGFAN
mgnify:CR=1 FL=1